MAPKRPIKEKLKLNACEITFNIKGHAFNFTSNLPDHFINFIKLNNLKLKI